VAFFGCGEAINPLGTLTGTVAYKSLNYFRK
jgi:hypothetical protein